MNLLGKLVVLSLLLLVSAGCSTRIAYNNLDWLTVRWVDRQVALDKDQRTLLRELIEEQQQWHCATQLEPYQTWIEQLRLDLLSGQLDRQRLAEHGERIAGFGRALAARIRPIVVELAASLDEQQVKQVLRELDERNDKLREEITDRSAEQWADDRVEGMERRLRRIMGAINADQQDLLQRWADELHPTHDQQLAQRLYWRDRIGKALAQRDHHQFLDSEISALLDPASAWPDDYRRVLEANRRLTLDALENLVLVANPDQTSRFSARLTRLKRDFERLSCQGETPAGLLAATDSG